MAYGFAKIATAAFDVAIADIKKNTESIIKLIHEATDTDVDIVVFPELSITGYTCGDLFLQHYIFSGVNLSLEAITKATMETSTLVVVGAPLRKDGMLFNTAVFIQNGEILGVVPKSFLPNYNEFYEKRWFTPAESRLSDMIDINGISYPFTPNLIIHTRNGLKVACEICEDLWVRMPPSEMHTAYGANLIVNLSASNDAPPINPPSTSGLENNSFALPALQLPPYKIEVLSATSLPYFSAIVLRIKACISCA